MKRIFLFVSVVLLLASIYLIILNFNNYMDLKLIYSYLLDVQTHAGWSEQGAYISKSNTSFYIYIADVIIRNFCGCRDCLYVSCGSK